MSDDLELVSAAADGELSAHDQPELDRLLETSAEAREFKAELEQLNLLIDRVPDLEPPESLHSRIMAQVEMPATSARTLALEMLRGLKLGTGLRYAVAAAAGALFVAIFMNGQLLLPETSDVSEMAGTISPRNTSADSNIVDSFGFRDGAIEGLVELEVDNGTAFLDIQIDSDVPLDVSLDLSGAGFWPDAVTQIEGHSESITISAQALQVQALGRQRLTISLGRVEDAVIAGEAEITLEFSSAGKLLRQGSLRAAW